MSGTNLQVERSHTMVSMYWLLLNMIPCITCSCPLTGEVFSWNENIPSVPQEIAGWVFSPGGEIPETSRYDRERKVFTIGDTTAGLAWQSRSMRKMDGFLYGVVDHEGEFTGDNIAFIYPDFSTGLRGTFVRGVLHNATAVDVVAERCYEGIKEIRMRPSEYGKDVIWEKEETNVNNIGKNRKVMDPYERKSVYVAQATNPLANEGLFAKRKFSRGDIVSYYGGQKLFTEDKVFSNMTIEEKQRAESCHLALGKYAPAWWGYPPDLLLDVPEEYRSVGEYRTTLGHKANHSFQNNAEYAFVDHPVLGGIACLVATKNIDDGEEVFAHYRYGDIQQVQLLWYREEYNHQYGARCFARRRSCSS